MRRTALLISLLLSGTLAQQAAHAATVAVEGDALRITANPGEFNSIAVSPAASGVSITDTGFPLTAGPGCVPQGPTAVLCATAARVEADLGDGDDGLTLDVPLPARVSGGDGNDALAAAVSAAATLDGGDGDDTLTGGPGADVLPGGPGDDTLAGAAGADVLSGDDGFDLLAGGDGDDRVDGGTGGDDADGGSGSDSIVLRDLVTDSAICGSGRDSVRAEVLDQLDFACERVDYGPPGSVGRLRPIIGGGRFVPIPGQPWALVDRRILPDVLYLIRRYHVRVGDGYATFGHTPRGEHPLGLAVDLYPGPGGSWREVGRLAKWAEPRQNRPRPPFRWVGWNGDANHGDPRHCRIRRGCPPHLHLSWDHSPGKPRRPVRKVWVFDVNEPPG